MNVWKKTAPSLSGTEWFFFGWKTKALFETGTNPPHRYTVKIFDVKGSTIYIFHDSIEGVQPKDLGPGFWYPVKLPPLPPISKLFAKRT